MDSGKRIALLGAPGSDRTAVSLALSELLKWPCVGIDPAESFYRELYGRETMRAFSIHELHTVGLVQFHERIRQEKIPCFISDGSVLNEPALRKAMLRTGRRIGNVRKSLKNIILADKYSKFIQKIESTIGDYAYTAYDKIYFLEKVEPDTKENEEYSACVNEALLHLMKEKNIVYKTVSGTSPDAIVGQILEDMNYNRQHH